MPRIKAKAKKRPLPISEDESPPVTPKRPNRRGGPRSRIAHTASPESFILGTESIICKWRTPADSVLPPTSYLYWTEEHGVINFDIGNATAQVPVVIPDCRTILSFIDSFKNRGKLELVINSSTTENLLLDVAASIPLPGCGPLISNLYGLDTLDREIVEVDRKHSWEAFFKELSQLQRSRYFHEENEYQHPDLVPKLRSYQDAAVKWMIGRESADSTTLDLSWFPAVTDVLVSRNGEKMLYCKYAQTLRHFIENVSISTGGILADEMGLGKTVITIALILNNRRNLELDHKNVSDISEGSEDSESEASSCESVIDRNQEGHLNADEKLQMVPTSGRKGLLKTSLNSWYEQKLAEMRVWIPQRSQRQKRGNFKCLCGETSCKPSKRIRCRGCRISQHKKCVGHVTDSKYLCPPCWTKEEPVPSNATLIVTPQSIFNQWDNEILRHAPSLSVHKYEKTDGFLQPTYLAKFDVVITTYNTLSAEIAYTERAGDRRLRNEERYLRKSCTLCCINWWRIVCDEAQMFEKDVSATRKMVQMLTACHRWSVTGTPIQKSIGDLFYLTEFMGLGPLDDKATWTDLLLTPYLSGCKEPLLSVLSQVFWRSSKDDVNSELQIPDQTFRHHTLKFSAIEESFYMQEHLSSAKKFSLGISKAKVPHHATLDSLDKSTLSKLLQPLLNLRQACTHPQVVSGVTITSATTAANLDELKTFLCRRTKFQCEESLRRHVATLNGLAGLHCITEDWAAAMGYYRSVVSLADRHDGEVHVDTLQRIHALTNAADVLLRTNVDVGRTLRDDKYIEEAKELERKYLLKPEENFNSSFSQFNVLRKEVKGILKEFVISHETWWVPVVYSLGGHEDELLDKLSSELISNEYAEREASKQFVARISTVRGLEVTLKNWWTSLMKHREKATAALTYLSEVPRRLLVQQAVVCHLRTKKQKEKRCELCRVEKLLLNLECELFTRRKNINERRQDLTDDLMVKSSWKPNYSERSLKILFKFAKSKVKLDEMCLQDGARHIKLIDVMKKEFKQLRDAWTHVNNVVQAEDEIEMCKIRMILRDPDESDAANPEMTPSLFSNISNKIETIHMVDHYNVPRMVLELNAEKDITYSDFVKKKGQVLYLSNLVSGEKSTPDPCPICKTSLEQQWCVLQCGHCFCLVCIQTLGLKRIKCPICREFTDGCELSFVDTNRVENSDVNVVGNFSTKVDGIMRVALQLLQEDPNTKILVFSAWPEVLKILTTAMDTNKVRYLHLKQSNHRKVISEFQSNGCKASVLLLPLNWGSKGLNLIQATHVFLVEPILNPAEELQAIGRVHRIGQTKETYVHRFLVKGTIEEKISATVSEAKDRWTNSTVTVNDLLKLFVIPAREEVLADAT